MIPVLEVAFDATASIIFKSPVQDDQKLGLLHSDGTLEK